MQSVLYYIDMHCFDSLTRLWVKYIHIEEPIFRSRYSLGNRYDLEGNICILFIHNTIAKRDQSIMDVRKKKFRR